MSNDEISGYKEFPCDVCGSTEAVEVPHVKEYTDGQLIHICKECGFVYVKKRRTYKEIARVWDKQLYRNWYTAYTPLMLTRHTYVAKFMDDKLKLKRKIVCDIGAGEGQFLKIVKDSYGASVFGIEPSTENCNLLSELRISNFDGTVEDYVENSDAKKGFADIVTIMWTLENATSCKDLLMCARKLLKDYGYLVVATGSRILVPFAKPLHMYFSTKSVDIHPSRFSANTLKALLLKTGFKAVYINPYLNDSLTMCVIAKKEEIDPNVKIKGDDYREVFDFFERWNEETKYYKKQSLV